MAGESTFPDATTFPGPDLFPGGDQQGFDQGLHFIPDFFGEGPGLFPGPDTFPGDSAYPSGSSGLRMEPD